MALVNIKNFSLSFGAKQVLHDVDLQVEKGSFTALVGESGSGKSVLALSLIQLANPTAQSGEIFFDDKDVMKFTKRQLKKIRGSRIGMIFQEPMTSLNPLHTIGKQIAEILEIYQPELKNLKGRVQELLVQVGLEEMANRLGAYPHQLSGGQRQRICIARALSLRPKFILLDEPTSALDVSIESEIIDLLKNLQKQYHISYIFVSHDLRAVRAIAHDVLVMQGGKMIEYGTTKEIFSKPKSEYTKRLIAAAFLNAA